MGKGVRMQGNKEAERMARFVPAPSVFFFIPEANKAA